MPNVGGVYVPDELMPRMAAPAGGRPSFGDIFTGAAEGAYGAIRYGVPYAYKKLADELQPGDEAFYQKGLYETGLAGQSAAPATVSDLTSGRVGLGRFVGENLVGSIPYMVSGAVGAAGGALAGGVPGAFGGFVAGAMPQFLGTNVQRNVEEHGGLSDVGAANSVLAAPLQAGSEALIGRFLPGAGHVIGDLAAAQSGNFLRRTAVSMAKAGATEAVTEAGQQLLERQAAGIPIADADAVGEYVNAAVTAFAVGGTLGAGGGFRRTNAVAKPADMVSTDDMLEHINAALDGSARASATAQPTEQQLGLPLEGGRSTEQQMGLPMAQPAQVDEVLPSQLPQLPLDPALSTVQPDTQLELGQRFRDNLTPADLPLEGGSTVSPELEDMLRANAAPAPGNLNTSTILSRGLDPQAQTTTDVGSVSLPEGFRPFQKETAADLDTLRKTKGITPEALAEVDREFAARAAEATGDASLTTENFQTRVDELKRGLRGGFVQSVEAANPAELMDKVYDQVFTNSDTRSNTVKFAQRLGLLDENLKPGPKAAEVEARRAAASEGTTATNQPDAGTNVQNPAPPSAPTAVSPQSSAVSVPSAPVQADVDAVVAAKKAIGVVKEGPLQALRTPSDVLAALGDEDAFKAKWKGDATRVEKLAKNLGLITDDDAMDMTPKGRQVFLQSPQGLEATVSAAADNGFAGAAASQFDRGVRAHLSGQEQTTFSGFDEMAAYNAGKLWAQDFVRNGEVRTAAQTASEIKRQDETKLGVRQAVGKKQIKPTERKSAERAPLTPEQLRTQSLNRLIDAADLRSVNDSDVVALRRMAREGVEPSELGKAIQKAQGGETLFREPVAPTEPKAFSPMPSRGQPRFREMNTQERSANRATVRAETDAAVRTFELRNLVDFALAEKAINRARAERLHAMLDEGNVAAVEKSMKNFLAEAQSVSEIGEVSSQLEQFLGDKDFLGALDHLVGHAPSAYHREIMKVVRNLAQKMEKAGVEFSFKIVRPGDMAPMALLGSGTKALATMTRNPATAKVWFKSAELGGGAGLNYQMVAHEMIHAVTMALVRQGNLVSEQNTKLGKATRDLYALQNAIADHFNARADAGNLSEFEQAFFRRENNALQDVDEILAWGLTNPAMQRYLASIEYKPRESVFSRLVSLIRDLLGLDAKYDTALTELLRVSEQIMDADAAGLQSTFPMNNPEGFAEGIAAARLETADDVSAANRTVGTSNETLKNFAAVSDKVLETLTPDDFKQKARRTMMRWLSHNQLNRMFGAVMPGLLKHTDAHRWRDAVRGNFEAMGDEVYQAFEKLERENRNAAEWVGQLMATATEFQVDPDKAWEDHTHIAEKDKARVKEMYDAAVKLKNDLSRGDGAGIKVYNQFRAFNEAQNYARLAAGLHNLVAMDPELAMGVQGSLINPTEAFLQQQGLTSGTAIRDWWQRTLLQQIAATTEFVNTKKGEAAIGNYSEQVALRQHLSPIEMQISAIHEAMAGMKKAPYFHLGRFGDYFASAKVRTNADGTVESASMEKVAAALAKAGFDDVQISLSNDRPKIVMRLDTADQTNRFKALMRELHAEGLLEGELKDAVKAGARSRENNYGQTDGFPAFVQNYIEAIEASPLYTPDADATPEEKAALERRKDEAVRLALDTWLEAQPDNSISKVLAKRYTVPGYKKDMVRNYAHRWRVGSISLANVASAPKFAEAFVDMRSAVEEAKSGDSDADQYLLNDLLAEMKARDASVPVNENVDSFDKARAIAHSYFLGLSPAYAMINMTQMGVVALPELAKKHGHTKSFAAMRQAGGDAWKIMKAAAAEAAKLGPQNWANVAITEDVLTKAGLSPETTAFALRMIASGTIDIGSQARSLGQVSENRVGSKLDMGLKYASALGMYSETFSRLTTALAAHRLHGGDLDSAAKYATDVVSNSMFDYQSWNTARAMGKKGVLGPVTPIVTQFMSYSVQMTEKLFSEFGSAIGRPREGETAEQTAQRAKEARTFLLGHLTAIVALTGTLGLPFMTVFATVLERMVDKMDDDDEPFDITAAYRGWLADVLGKDVAEVVSRGLPRVFGFDLSARAGEQNLLPFSEFFADRRPWKEAIEANVGRSLGAVPSMVSNIITGGGKIADGDVLGGMKEMLPVSLKGVTEAYRMYDGGYVDSQGNKLPMSPGAAAMAWQLLGFTPAEKAEYSEVRGDLQSRRGEISRRAGVLRDGIVKALIERDMEKANELLGEARKFDIDNPSVGLVNSVPAALQRRVMNSARANALRTPLGVSMNDIAGQKMAQYANVNYGN